MFSRPNLLTNHDQGEGDSGCLIQSDRGGARAARREYATRDAGERAKRTNPPRVIARVVSRALRRRLRG